MITESLCNECKYIFENIFRDEYFGYFDLFEDITKCFYLIFINSNLKIKSLDKISKLFRYTFKSFVKNELSSAYPIMTNCLDFLTFMCKYDISFVYTQRDDLFDYLDEMNNILTTTLNDDQFDWEDLFRYQIAGLNLIENLIKNWNFEIYILLDRDGINAFINRCKHCLTGEEPEDDVEVKIKLMATNISNQIFNYKASLRKYFIMNGYPKKLN
jgi:hypothetical protein